MTASSSAIAAPSGLSPQRILKWSGVTWFLVAAAGQWIFVYYILVAFGPPTLAGEFARWDDTGLIKGHEAGDHFGNFMFAVHVFLAALITFGGTLQLVPALRNRFRGLHRWNGRVFVVTALILAAGGLWMTWVRDTRLSDLSGLGVGLNGILILIAAPMTAWLAAKRQIDAHRKWAMRLFILVNGVWFFRLFLMGWIFILQEPLWMNNTLDGPYQLFASFACYLLPLVGLELYFRATQSSSSALKIVTSVAVFSFSALMAVSIFAAYMMMWAPHL